MSAPSSPATASSTMASTSPGGGTGSSASQSPTAVPSCLCDGPECRSTRMCERSMALRLASIFWPVGSPAREVPRPASERGSAILRLRCGEKWPESSASFDPGSSCWRMSQTSLLSSEAELGARYSATWPRSAMWADGTVYPLPPLVPRTSAIGSSALLPTPTSHERTHTPRQVASGRQLANELALLPTPRTSDQNGPGLHGQGGMDLRTAMQLLPTPHGMPKEGQARRPGPTGNELGRAITLMSGGEGTSQPSDGGSDSTAPRLNPSFVEWMIGAPQGWSDPDCPLSATEFSSRLATSSDTG